MTTANLIKTVIIAATFVAGVANAADNTINVTNENGKSKATFTIASSRCILVDDNIRCSSIVIAQNDR